MSLRPLVVEAVAAEILRWGIKPEKLPAGQNHLAGLVVDRVVSVLGDHADEWADYPEPADPTVVAHREIIARKLLAELTTEEET